MEQQQTMNKKLIIFPIIMFFCVVFMSVGYASITNDLLVVSGQVSANSQTGVFITDIDYANDTDAVLANSNIRDYIGTTMHSNIELSANNHNSLITYDITVYNSTNYDFLFEGVLFDSEFYSNNDIEFRLTGLQENDVLDSKDEITFSITFFYKDGISITNSILESFLNFSFKKIFSVTYTDFEDTSSYPTIAIEGRTLTVNLGAGAPDLIDVFIDDVLQYDRDFSYDAGVVAIPNVNGNILIDNQGVEIVDTSIYCWDEDYLTVAYKNTLLNRLNALNIVDLYVRFNSPMENYKDMIAYLKQHNITVHHLDGDKDWYSDVEPIKAQIDRIYEYNVNNPTNRIAGIVLDVEPYNMAAYKENYLVGFQTYVTTMEQAYAYAQSKNVKMTVAIPYWYDNYFTYDEYTAENRAIALELFKRLVQSADRLSVMNYYRSKIVSHLENELYFAKMYNREVESISEFGKIDGVDVTEAISFYNEKNPVKTANIEWQIIHNTYDYTHVYFSFHYLKMIFGFNNESAKYRFVFVDETGHQLDTGYYTATFSGGETIRKWFSSSLKAGALDPYTLSIDDYDVLGLTDETVLEDGSIQRTYAIKKVERYTIELYGKHADKSPVTGGTLKLVDTANNKEYVGRFNETGNYYIFNGIAPLVSYKILYTSDDGKEYTLNTANANNQEGVSTVLSDDDGNIFIPRNFKENGYIGLKIELNQNEADIDNRVDYHLEIYPKLWNGTRYSSIKAGKVKLVDQTTNEEHVDTIKGDSNIGYYVNINVKSDTDYKVYILDLEDNVMNYNLDSAKYRNANQESETFEYTNNIVRFGPGLNSILYPTFYFTAIE